MMHTADMLKAFAPYREDAATAPLGAYGRSKLAGERALAASDAPAIVLRTAWVYSPRRKSFVASIKTCPLQSRPCTASRTLSQGTASTTMPATLRRRSSANHLRGIV